MSSEGAREAPLLLKLQSDIICPCFGVARPRDTFIFPLHGSVLRPPEIPVDVGRLESVHMPMPQENASNRRLLFGKSWAGFCWRGCSFTSTMASGRKTWGFLEHSFALAGVAMLGLIFFRRADSLELNRSGNISEVESEEVFEHFPPNSLVVGLTLVQGAAEKGAVCLDGTLPGYHLHRGFGLGVNNWVIQLEGGGWCNDERTCSFRKTTRRGSSRFMEHEIVFSGILSNKRWENPGFYNWNRVKIRYCDGASFSGDVEGENKVPRLYYRGQRIWKVAIEDLLAKGMYKAKRALLSGCSAGGLASILHCDEFHELMPRSAMVKCLSDAGLFLDVLDVSGGYYLRSFFKGVVTLQGAAKNLPTACTSRMDPTQCFFPQYLLPYIKTPLFILNTAYDSWQVQSSLAPAVADPSGLWYYCKLNPANCTTSQLKILQNFRNEMLNALKVLVGSRVGGMFINSCFAHCQSERQDTWFAPGSPRLKKTIAEAVGDWYFDRSVSKEIDCPYPCDQTCHNLIFKPK